MWAQLRAAPLLAGRLTLGLVLSGLLVSSALAGGRFQMPHFGDPTAMAFTEIARKAQELKPLDRRASPA